MKDSSTSTSSSRSSQFELRPPIRKTLQAEFASLMQCSDPSDNPAEVLVKTLTTSLYTALWVHLHLPQPSQVPRELLGSIFKSSLICRIHPYTHFFMAKTTKDLSPQFPQTPANLKPVEDQKKIAEAMGWDWPLQVRPAEEVLS